VKHNYFTKKYPSKRAREAAKKLLWPDNWRKNERENSKKN
jgi:hypothetical protein